jgi:hypothetical protein
MFQPRTEKSSCSDSTTLVLFSGIKKVGFWHLELFAMKAFRAFCDETHQLLMYS